MPAVPHYWSRLLPALAALALVTRVPSFLRPVWNPDEGYLATQARMLADGGALYDTVVDRKPPLLPWTYQACFALFGDGSLQPLRVLAVGAHLMTAVALASTARRRWGDHAGAAAGALYLLISIGLAPEDTQTASFEVFMLPGTAWAFRCAERRQWASAGTCAALAALTKQTAGVVLLPLAWMLWRRRDVRGTLTTALGFALPVTAVALATGPGGFLFWTVTGNGDYAALGDSWRTAFARAAGNAAVLAVAAAAPLAAVIRLRVGHRAVADPALWLWLAGSGLAVLAGLRFFGHYYLQLVPPLTLLGVAALRRLPHWWRPVLACTALTAAGYWSWGVVHPAGELDHTRVVAASVREHTAPKEEVLIWGMHPEDYWFADRRPASRFLTAGLLTNFGGGRGDERVGEEHGVPGAWVTFREELRTRPPALVVDDSRGAPYRPAQIPELRRFLDRHYRRLDTADGAVLYTRR
ncbi:glycosyltransferase [Wenjunlia vitaminophila]|uniref:Glycosyltransferase n=1 Tax=Wenjunlia vitaminophila TaxID=76728 RepID=A0A0T6LZD8_WENVI|nr:glycosyltransferase family 39 protein [Wenjunlia vitaminophila]KRV51381.1 glycosyltransferase [Wenjunlia vitaminophila]